MLVNCLVRVAQGLALTTLELTTLSFILIFFITSFCWYYKPSGVTTRITLRLGTHLDLVLIEVCQWPVCTCVLAAKEAVEWTLTTRELVLHPARLRP